MGSSVSGKKVLVTLRNVYFRCFDFRLPLRVIPSGDFLKVCWEAGLDIGKIFEDMDIKVKFYTTSCILNELRQEKHASLSTAREFEILRYCCGNTGKSTSSQCVNGCTDQDNRYKYSIAIQDFALKELLADRVAPVFTLDSNNTLILLKPGRDLSQRARGVGNSMMHISPQEKALLQDFAPIQTKKKAKYTPRKKSKAPNPLSMKKKKRE